MPVNKLEDLITTLPLVLADPISQRVTPTSVTAWIAFQEAVAQDRMAQSKNPRPASSTMGGGPKISVRKNLHLAVTAQTATNHFEVSFHRLVLAFDAGPSRNWARSRQGIE
jgi:hypothetical protein